MDNIEIPPRFSERTSHYANQPLISEKEARKKKEIYSQRPGIAVEFNRLRWMISLTQVYSLQFLNFGGDDLQQLYGTVRLGMSCHEQILFDRQIGNNSNHDIDEKGYARLSGPMRPMNGDYSFVIHPRLFKKNNSQGLFHPARIDEVIYYDRPESPFRIPSSLAERNGLYGKWLLEERDTNYAVLYSRPDAETPHNKILRDVVETTAGPIAVTYSVFIDGIEAFVRIKLLKLCKELGQSANVYGTVCASSAMLNDPRAKSYILDRKRDEQIHVRAQQFIPLQRPSTSVPHGHELKLDLCIMHRELNSRDDGDSVIAEYKLNFMPKCWLADSDEYISDYVQLVGDLCSVQVEVFWAPWWAIHYFY